MSEETKNPPPPQAAAPRIGSTSPSPSSPPTLTSASVLMAGCSRHQRRRRSSSRASTAWWRRHGYFRPPPPCPSQAWSLFPLALHRRRWRRRGSLGSQGNASHRSTAANTIRLEVAPSLTAEERAATGSRARRAVPRRVRRAWAGMRGGRSSC